MISAVILAAGQSQRMGRPKMALGWEASTVLGHIIDVLHAAGVEDVLVVSGGDRAAVEEIAATHGARQVFNPRHAEQEMLSSLQIGLRNLPGTAHAAMVVLGDQPQVQESTVRRLLERYSKAEAALVVPSYNMRRGHPWLVQRALWDEILGMLPPETPRDFLRSHAKEIVHVVVETPTILADLDTPDDYLKSHS